MGLVTDYEAYIRLVASCAISSRRRAAEAVEDLSESMDRVISLR